MDVLDKLVLDMSLQDIVEQLKVNTKWKILIIGKGVLRGQVVDEIFDAGLDKEEAAYEFVKQLRNQAPTQLSLFIDALKESGQQDLARTLAENRTTARETLRRGVKEALALGSENQITEGRVVVDRDLMDKCRAFADGSSDNVPGPLQYMAAKHLPDCIARLCAEQLVRHLGGNIEVVVGRQHGGLVFLRQASGEVVLLLVRLVVKGGEEDPVMACRTWPDAHIQFYLQNKFEGVYQKVSDAAGAEVDTSQTWGQWWPTAAVGSSGRKEVHVWKTQAPRPHEVEPLPKPPGEHDVKPLSKTPEKHGARPASKC